MSDIMCFFYQLENIFMEDLLKQGIMENSPGFFGILSLDSKLLSVNRTGIKWIGFSNDDAISGLSYEDMRCKAAEDAVFFIHQDELVKAKKKPIYFIGFYEYNNNEWKTVFGKKYPIINSEGTPIAIVSQFDEISNYNLIDTYRFMSKSQKRFKKNMKQFGYILEDNHILEHLTNREAECLFFLLRGKTSKSIATLLNLSVRTVEYYIENIKNKMRCNGKEELIEKAINEGYLNIIPQNLFHRLEFIIGKD